MATIRGYAELYRNGGLDEPSALDDAIRRTEQEAVRMGSLVDDLLHLPASTKDARSSRSRSTSRRWRSMPPVMRARSTPVAGAGRTDGPVMVTGDEFRLRQVVANVVGNAMVHTRLVLRLRSTLDGRTARHWSTPPPARYDGAHQAADPPPRLASDADAVDPDRLTVENAETVRRRRRGGRSRPCPAGRGRR